MLPQPFCRVHVHELLRPGRNGFGTVVAGGHDSLDVGREAALAPRRLVRRHAVPRRLPKHRIADTMSARGVLGEPDSG